MATILIVDDDENLCSCIMELMSASGHQCHRAGDADQAMRMLGELEVDLLILDVMIPGISGFELCRRVHASPQLYGIPILFLSAMNSEEEIAHGLAQGADDYLTKPFKADTLRTHVERLLASHSQARLMDDLTELASPKGIKLEIQRAMMLKQPFAVAYVELMYLNEFARLAGQESRGRAIRHMARGLQLCGEDMQSSCFKAGHMGGGHFVCMFEAELVETFGLRVSRMWERHRPRLYESVGADLKDPKTLNAGPPVDVVYCATLCNASEKNNVQALFEVLSNLRKKAINRPGDTVFVDRRI